MTSHNTASNSVNPNGMGELQTLTTKRKQLHVRVWVMVRVESIMQRLRQ
jgi:hypothetical protein